MGYRKNLLVLFILVIVLAVFSSNTSSAVPLPIGEWGWPLDGHFVVLNSARYGTTLENTDYGVKNLDLVHSSASHITCFNVGWHRAYHAGVDLYLANGNTAGAAVKSVSDGIVVHIDNNGVGDNLSVIVKHPIQGVWSVFWHLTNVQVSLNEEVSMGQVLGYVYEQSYTGRFPIVHPYGQDDSHLHFEIRTFEDGGNLFPNNPQCNTGYQPGVGYTYPDPPDIYGYRDPIEFIEDRIIPPLMPYQLYVPMISSDQSCIEGQNLIQYNSGFEFPVDDPEPWFDITTYFEPPNIFYYHLVQDDPYHAYAGNHFAFFGDQIPSIGRIVDEEMVQSFRVPGGVTSLKWIQYLWLEQTGGSPKSYGTELGDKYIFALQDAETGVSLRSDIVIDHTSVGYPNYVWLKSTITIPDASDLAGKAIRPSYSSITDGDTKASTLRVDQVSLITHCGSGQNQNVNETVEEVNP